MDRQLRITEVSICFEVGPKPRTPVSKVTPFVVDGRNKDVERVVLAGTDTDYIPDWVGKYKRGQMKFVYASDIQDIDCTFKESDYTLTFGAIKYDNLERIEGCLEDVFRILGTEPVSEPRATYKAMLVISIGVRWDRDLVADIITNYSDVCQTVSMLERVSVLGNRRLFSVSVLAPTLGSTCSIGHWSGKTKATRARGQKERGAVGAAYQEDEWPMDQREHFRYVRATLRPDDKNGNLVTVAMSKLPSTETSAYVAAAIENVFRVYRARYANAVPSVRQVPDRSTQLSGIRHLRSELPELFVNNYTRECPVLPIMISQEQAELLEDVNQRVIFYPTGSPMGRFYTAPKGHFVGLKKNRLDNRNIFPCLVTCYLHDHMLRRGSETYTYYTGEVQIRREKYTRPVPRSMGYSRLVEKGLGYDRKKAESFINAVEIATGQNIDTASLPWCPQVARQEMWHATDVDIMSMIRSPDCGPSAYRYFEEYLGVSIHVVTIRNGIFEPLVQSYGPRSSKSEYIWAPPYPQHVVVFETIKKTYGRTGMLYDVLVRNSSNTVFSDTEPAISSIVAQKRLESVPPVHIAGAVEQLIDDKGVCREITMLDGEQIQTFTRPLTVPVVPERACFFDSHIRKMNNIKEKMGIGAIDLYKRSTNDILYFPNDGSYQYWLNMRFGSGL